MSALLLTTKLYLPPPPPKAVPRPRLIARLNEGLQRKLALVSAPAGFGKTTLLSEWVAALAGSGVRAAWLSLDAGDSDPARFLVYLAAALQTLSADIGQGALAALQSPQPPAAEAVLTALLNEIAAFPAPFVLVLDDYHLIDSQAADQALAYLLEGLPPQMHLVVASREDPNLPLARYRARGQMIELRAADLRFTAAEAAEFLEQAMGLNLSADDIAALEARTEGWIAGLQLAAVSMRGHPDAAGFIQSFSGSHHFVLDYLVEEVLQRQPASVQGFLLRTSILARLCGPLCDALLLDPAVPGQETLEYLARANLFTVPLDDERRWYRYHHLFSDLLRQRLGERLSAGEIAALHLRASEWCERNGLAFEAFHHAAQANDLERAERLIGSKEMSLHLRSVALPILEWLASLSEAALDARPGLRVRSATLALVVGQSSGVEEKLQAAEQALQGVALDEQTRDLHGQIACARATLALTRYDPEAMIAQARRALEHLHPENLAFRFSASWVLTTALMFRGDRAAAARACQESLAISQKAGSVFSKILAISLWGELQELNNQLHPAAETYRQALELSGQHPLPYAQEACLGLARIAYQWNDLETAERYAQQSLQFARLYDRVIDRFIVSEVFLARLKLAWGDAQGAAALLAQTEQAARQKNFALRLPEIAAAQALVLLRQGDPAAAARLARQYDLPLIQARLHLAQGDSAAALAALAALRRQMEAKGWADELLKVMVLQAVVQHARGEREQAVQTLGEALELAEPGGFIRLFVDEGAPMAELLSAAAAQGLRPGYVRRLLAAFEAQAQGARPTSSVPGASPLIEPLTPRELEVLRLIAQGLSNREIGARLFLALDTVKGHNRRIFEKLQVQRRTEAIARARELGVL